MIDSYRIFDSQDLWERAFVLMKKFIRFQMYSDEGRSPQPNWGSLSSKNRADPDINQIIRSNSQRDIIQSFM